MDDLLSNPEARTSDRLKAIQIVLSQCGGGAVANFGVQKSDDSHLSFEQREQSIEALLRKREALAARRKALKERDGAL